MALTVGEIAERLGGRVEGDAAAKVTGVAGIREAGPGDITFLANPRYASEAAKTKASAILVGEDWRGVSGAAVIRVKDPNAAFAEVASWLAERLAPVFKGIHPTALIAPDVRLGRDVSVGPYCVLEPGVAVGDRTILVAGCYLGHGVTVGADCRFYPHVTVREHVRIGDRVIIHNGTVIGSDGFGYNREGAKWKKIPQTGIVVIGGDVEIGANVCVDRARFGETRIGSGTKIDNLVQVAHNVTIGSDTAIAGQVGIAGSSSVGSRVQIGGQAGITGHVTVGDDCVIGGQSGVSKDVPNGSFVFGFPAVPYAKAMKIHAHMMRLPELKKRVVELEERLGRLEKELGRTGNKPEGHGAE